MDRMLDKIAKLLNQAEHAANEAEAETFMKKAQALATTEAIDLAVARQHTAKKEDREKPIQKSVKIGERGKKALKLYVELFSEIANVNDVKMNIARDSSWVYLFGMPSDIDVVEVLYGNLVHQMVEAANAWLKLGTYKKETETRKVRRYDEVWGDYSVDFVEKPVDGRTARASFYRAFTSRVGWRLRDARRDALRVVENARYEVMNDVTGERMHQSAEIVLKGKAVEVHDFYQATSTAKGSWKGSSAGFSGAGSNAGRQAGDSARIGSPKAIGGTRTGINA